MSANWLKYVSMGVGVALVVALVWLMFATERRTAGDGDTDVVIRFDTVVVVQRDTVRQVRQVRHTEYRYDTIVRRDTVYIADKPQQYEDSTAEYRLRINAVKLYDYELDLYRVDSCTTIVPKVALTPKKSAKWGQSVVVGVQVGYGLGVQPATMRASWEPYIGVGITYGFGVTW